MNDSLIIDYLTLLERTGCKFKFKTELFGKPYVWMQARDGQLFLERLPVEKFPVE